MDDALIEFKEKWLPELQKRIAAGTSPCSERSEPRLGQLSRKIGSGRQALQLIFISTFFDYWNSDKIIRAIGQKAYQNNYQGVWQEVQDFLELYQNDPIWFASEYLKRHSPEAFFGDFLKSRVERERKMVQLKPDQIPSYLLPRVRPKVRHRGYDDKGHWRPPHEEHGDPPIPKNDKIDRRPWIHHPLLEDKEAQEYGIENASQKGEGLYEQSS